MTHHRLLGLLEALSDEEFEKFQWSLRYNSDGKVTKAQLDGVNRMTTVDVMIQTCTADGAVKITQSTLETIQRNDLVGKHPDAGSGPGSAKQKTGYELAKEPAAKKPALKKAVVKDHKTATKQAPKKPTSTNKAPAKKEAQPKEVKPRKAISKKKNVINVDKSVGEKTALETATKEAPKKPTSTNKAPAKKKAHPKEAKPRKAISKKKMDLKTAPEGPREPHKKLHPKKRRKKERFQVLSATDKRGRKKKDPNAPKRPLSPFFLFCHERRPFVKEQQPGLSLGDCAKKLGQMWTQLSQYYKQPYEKKAQELREKYDTDMVAYRKISQGGNEDNDKEGDDDDVQENDDKNANRNMFCVGNPSTVPPTSHFGGAHSADASQLERTWFNSHLGGFDSIFGPFGH